MTILVLVLSITCQLAAAAMALLLIRSTGARAAWTLIAVALVLMTVRRLTTLGEWLAGDIAAPDAWTEWTALGISVLMLLGVAGIGPVFGRLRHVEQALRESQRKLSTLLHNLPGMAYRCANDREWTMEFVSQGCQAVTGYEPADLIGNRLLSYNDMIHPDDRQPVWDEVQAALAAKRPFRLEYRIRTASGEEKWVWEQGVGVLGEGGAIVALEGFITDITERRRVHNGLEHDRDDLERRVEERTAELAELNRQLTLEIADRRQAEEALSKEREVLRQLLDLQERSRQLVAYEIHDGFVQLSTGALMSLQSLPSVQLQNPAEAEKLYHRGVDLLRESIAEARRLMGGLRPAALDESGVVAAVESLVEEANRSGAAAVELVRDVQFHRLAPPLETAVFRIVQEGLLNALRHSQTSRVQIRMKQEGGLLRLEVQDWGVGFDPEHVPQGHFGVAGIRNRARAFNGHATITSAPGQGTLIAVELPLVDRPPEDAPPH